MVRRAANPIEEKEKPNELAAQPKRVEAEGWKKSWRNLTATVEREIGHALAHGKTTTWTVGGSVVAELEELGRKKREEEILGSTVARASAEAKTGTAVQQTRVDEASARAALALGTELDNQARKPDGYRYLSWG